MKRKKILLGIFMALMVFSITISCVHAEDKLDLRLRLEKGQSYKTKMIKDIRTQYSVQGKQQNITTKTETKNIYTVEDVQTDGVAVVKFIYDALFFQHEYPGGKITYDSSNPSDAVGQGMSIFNVIVGQSFTINITPDGHVKEIQGADVLLKRIQEKVNELDVQARAYVETSFKMQYGEGALKANTENSFNMYPDKPVGIGDTWQKKTTVLFQEIPMIVNSIYTLKERKDGITTIDVFEMIQSNQESAPTEMGPMKLRYNISGSVTGLMEIQESTGWPIRFNQSLRLSGSVRVESPEMQQPTSTPISLSGSITLEPF